ncbi:MAG: hypothetical protein PHO48_02475 [Candidatus Gracilibacteria bacterium]|nr:hypothetical protein [Candidatus Gracilibacteria bacterium]MDD5178644.1 hypothetical protein [Candidatus Gracilibacteria bacterium]
MRETPRNPEDVIEEIQAIFTAAIHRIAEAAKTAGEEKAWILPGDISCDANQPDADRVLELLEFFPDKLSTIAASLDMDVDDLEIVLLAERRKHLLSEKQAAEAKGETQIAADLANEVFQNDGVLTLAIKTRELLKEVMNLQPDFQTILLEVIRRKGGEIITDEDGKSYLEVKVKTVVTGGEFTGVMEVELTIENLADEGIFNSIAETLGLTDEEKENLKFFIRGEKAKADARKAAEELLAFAKAATPEN